MLFTRAFPTRSFASPRGLYKEVFLACSIHSVRSHIVALDSSLSRSALLYSALLSYARAPLLSYARAPLLSYARAPLLISRLAPSASSPPATLVYTIVLKLYWVVYHIDLLSNAFMLIACSLCLSNAFMLIACSSCLSNAFMLIACSCSGEGDISLPGPRSLLIFLGNYIWEKYRQLWEQINK